MPARGRRSAKPFTRRRSAAAFRLRPPVPRMNLSPNRGREDGAAVRPGPPGVVRLRPLLAGRQDLPGWGMAARSAPCGGRFAARSGAFADALFSAAFCRRPFSAARPFGAAPLFFVPDGTVRSAPLSSLSPLRSVPSPLCPLSALSPLRSAPSPLCPLSAPSPLRSVPSPLCPLSAPSPLRSVPSPLRPLSAPSRSRPVPVPVPVPSFGGAPLRRFFSVRGLKNRKNCLDL